MNNPVSKEPQEKGVNKKTQQLKLRRQTQRDQSQDKNNSRNGEIHDKKKPS